MNVIFLVAVVLLSPMLARADAKDDCAAAKRDAAIGACDEAIRQSPREPRFYFFRANAYFSKGEYDRAIADYDRAIEIDPKDANHVSERGLARFSRGDFKNAAVDLSKAIELGDGAYSVLLRYLARIRIGEAAETELASNAVRLKTKEWPFAAIELCLGKRSRAALLDEAVKPDDRCEAQFYIEQWHLMKGNRSEAKVGLKAAVATCPMIFRRPSRPLPSQSG